MGDVHDLTAQRKRADYVKRRKILLEEAMVIVNGVSRDLPKFRHDDTQTMGVFKLALAEAAARLAVLEQEPPEPPADTVIEAEQTEPPAEAA